MFDRMYRTLRARWERYTLSRVESVEEQLENLIQVLAKGNDDVWLWRNREERMDANSVLFDESRRRFHVERYRFAKQFVTGRVLDCACGTGYGSAVLAEGAAVKAVSGGDVDARAVEYARRHHAVDNVEFDVLNALDTGLGENIFDSVVSFETLEHLENPERAVEEFARLLVPNGVLVCSTPNDWGLTAYHKVTLTYHTFVQMLSGKFTVESCYNQNSGAGPRNHGQPAGFTLTSDSNATDAECFVAVCRKKL